MRSFLKIAGFTLLLVGLFIAGWVAGLRFGLPEFLTQYAWTTPFVEQVLVPTKELPLEKYTISNLHSFAATPSTITVGEPLPQSSVNSYYFKYQTLGRTMSGQVNIPAGTAPADGFPVILMIRGYVPAAGYTTGTGTRNAAAVFAQQGYVTIAPDFFGYGESDPETEDPWQARLEKPLSVIELLKTVQTQPTVSVNNTKVQLNPNRIGIWGHSNGGQISLTALEILRQPIPTTLWAPVTAPFPYSVLFYSDEEADEGKAMRRWVAQFEQDYDVLDFSLSQHLNLLTGPLMIHQGTADDAVPFSWNDEFVQKLETENTLRQELGATYSALPAVELTYHRYPGADHNMKPVWNQVVQRDLEFFKKYLSL